MLRDNAHVLTCAFRIKNAAFALRNAVDVATLFGIWYRGVYGDLKIKSGDVVLDAGANIGVFSIYAASKGASKVIAVEPDSSNFKLLTKNLVLNNVRNVSAVKCALSDFNGVGFIMGENVEAGLSNDNQGERVDVRTLDTLLAELGISKVDVIKMDIEGAEVKVLLDSRSLTKAREVIVEAHGFDSQRECVKILKLNGFQFRYVDSRRIFFNHLRRIAIFSDYVVTNMRTNFIDFKTYLDFVLAKMGVMIAVKDCNFQLIYAYRDSD